MLFAHVRSEMEQKRNFTKAETLFSRNDQHSRIRFEAGSMFKLREIARLARKAVVLVPRAEEECGEAHERDKDQRADEYDLPTR